MDCMNCIHVVFKILFIIFYIYGLARKGEGRVVYKVLVGKPGGNRPLRRPGRRWEDNIKMDLQEV